MSITDASDAIELLQGEKKCTPKHIDALLFAVAKGARKEMWKGAYEICLLHKMMFPAGGATRIEDRVFAKGSAHSYAEPPTYPLLEKFIRSFDFTNPSWFSIAQAHYELCLIHPFTDGNGRLARVFSNWHITFLGFNVVKLGPQRREYIGLLERADIHGLAELFEQSQTIWRG